MDGFYKTIVLSILCSFLLYTNTSIGSSDHEEKRFLLNKLSHDAPNKTRNYLKCMHCTGVDNPEACLDEMVCAPGQFCYIDKKFVYDLGGRMEYTAGCRSKSICHLQTCLLNASNAITKRDTEEYDSTGHSRRRSTTFLECSECCTKDRCNRKLCGFSQSQNSPRCFQCSLIDDPKKCQDETFCEDTQVCSVTAYAFIGSNGTVEKRYDQGCVSNYTCSFFQKNSKTTVAPPETTAGQGVELLPPIGRRYSDRSRRYIQIAFGCCKGDLCNTFDLAGDDGDLGEIALPDGYQCPTIAPPTTAATTAIPTTTIPTTESTTPPSTVPLTTTPTTAPTTPTTVPSTTPIPSTTTTKAAVKPSSTNSKTTSDVMTSTMEKSTPSKHIPTSTTSNNNSSPTTVIPIFPVITTHASTSYTVANDTSSSAQSTITPRNPTTKISSTKIAPPVTTVDKTSTSGTTFIVKPSQKLTMPTSETTTDATPSSTMIIYNSASPITQEMSLPTTTNTTSSTTTTSTSATTSTDMLTTTTEQTTSDRTTTDVPSSTTNPSTTDVPSSTNDPTTTDVPSSTTYSTTTDVPSSINDPTTTDVPSSTTDLTTISATMSTTQVTTTTQTPTTTIVAASCYLCNGPAFLCEQLYAPRQCASVTQQYCINDVTQNYDGSRTVNRRCATKDECEREWWQQTSDRAECSSYDPNQFIAQEQFSCTFCCRSSLCNRNVVPDDLYVAAQSQPTPATSAIPTTVPTTIPTTSPTTATTSTPTTPAKPFSCYLCNGPAFLCEQLYAPRQCASVTQQYCINDMIQNYDGSRTVKRRCGTKDECEREWWQQTSDRAECSSFDPDQFIAQEQFTCTFCCRSSLCNRHVVPDDLYVGTEIQGR